MTLTKPQPPISFFCFWTEMLTYRHKMTVSESDLHILTGLGLSRIKLLIQIVDIGYKYGEMEALN